MAEEETEIQEPVKAMVPGLVRAGVVEEEGIAEVKEVKESGGKKSRRRGRAANKQA